MAQTLTDEWEARLSAEGMPAEIRSMYQGRNASDPQFYPYFNGNPADSERDAIANGIGDLPLYLWWSRFSETFHAMELSTEQVDFLIDYAEHGFLSRSCRRFGIVGRWPVEKMQNLVRKVTDKMKHIVWVSE